MALPGQAHRVTFLLFPLQVVGVDSGGLKSERQEEMEFAHPCFLRGNEQLLDQIRRKVSICFSPKLFLA